MKYESEIIKDIVDSRGHEKTSLHYESECVEKWIKEVEGAYPKLCDYRPEWLNYSNETKIGVFPYTTLTDVTNATIENVVPYAYKSAILKGNTLVNILPTCINKPLTKTTHSNYIQFFKPLESGKEYTIIISLSNAVATTDTKILNIRGNKIDGSYSSIYDAVFKITNGIQKVKFTPTDSFVTCLVAINGNAPEGTSVTMDYLMFIEGDHTDEDIPYFTGMQSVKMPVLTTVGKNLFNPEKMVIDKGSLYGYYKVKDNENIKCTLSISDKDTSVDISNIFFGMSKMGENADGGVAWLISNGLVTYPESLSIITNHNFISIYPNNIETLNKITKRFNIQVEYGEVKTTYEPYKSNILSCLELVELGSVGEVKDELNLLTQQLTQRTETRPYQEGDELNSEFVTDMTNTRYKLAQEVAKTVDLSVVDQDGNEREQIKPIEGTMNLNTSGETLKPLFSGEIPVEAITQNLASFTEE